MPISTDEESVDEQVLTLNPVVGVNLEDLLGTAMNVIREGVVQPAVAAQHLLELNAELARVLFGTSALAPKPRDKRFAAEAFQHNPVFSRLAQGWLAWQQSLGNWVEAIGFEGEDLDRARFITSLAADAFAPTNFLLGNPAALNRALETRGQSLVAGAKNWLHDLRENDGMPSQVDKSAFSVGTNLATTPGSVIHRSEILELIQYQPSTDQVSTCPVMIVPPQINKYYVYDLSPEKSMVRFLLEAGMQVFMVSWRNPQVEHRSWGLDDYVSALDKAIEVTCEVADYPTTHTVGACAGGITLASALGYLAGKGEDARVRSLTLMVNVLQPASEDSVMGLFANDDAIETARKKSARAGILDGKDTARVFNWMRPNDLIWNYVVSNYLLGESPPAFDILYWNNDTTRLPARLHSDFLDVFKDNALSKQGALEIHGVPVDLKRISCPAFVTGGTTDHITPWQACYRTTQLLGGPVDYVLSTAGHIQSLINPPGNSKRKFHTNPNTPADSREWLRDSEEHPGSWWPYWTHWLEGIDAEKKSAPTEFGNANYPELVPAPGTYVFE